MGLLSKKEIKELFDKMASLHVVVIGDVMLDNYWWGEVERISPEAPVPVVALQKRESRLGGAANVALNCKALGAKVSLASIVGDDREGEVLISLTEDAGIGTELISISNKRLTTTKTRVISRNQQMMRLDAEDIHDLDMEDEHPFIDSVLRFLQREKPQVVIFEDYNKGLLKENVISRVIAHCNEIGIITAVDPKWKNFMAYKNVTIFKPNLKEVREALHIPLQEINIKALNEVRAGLNEQLDSQIIFITLSEKGVYYGSDKGAAIIPSHIRNIADVSGAGDTVIAAAAMIYALTGDAAQMAEIANIAGGLVCEDVGVVPISKKALIEETEKLLS